MLYDDHNFVTLSNAYDVMALIRAVVFCCVYMYRECGVLQTNNTHTLNKRRRHAQLVAYLPPGFWVFLGSRTAWMLGRTPP